VRHCAKKEKSICTRIDTSCVVCRETQGLLQKLLTSNPEQRIIAVMQSVEVRGDGKGT